MTAIWVGSEDIEYVSMGGAPVSTTSGEFRTPLGSRCALRGTSGGFWQSILPYSESDFWFSARVCTESGGNQNNIAAAKILTFNDTSLVERIRIVGLGSFMWAVQKVTASGTATTIGNSFYWPLSSANGICDKIDVHIHDAVSGAIDIWINLSNVFNFTGDTTTDSVTTLCYHRLGGNGLNHACWSETWVDDADTRSQALASFSPVANGNANTFDTGTPSASNINETTLDVTTLNGSSTAAQIDQYTNGAVPSGTLDIKGLIVSAYAQKGASGPSKMDLGVRTGGSNYWGSDKALTTAWSNYQEIFSTNPGTSAAWLKSDIGNASGFNIGVKSVT